MTSIATSARPSGPGEPEGAVFAEPNGGGRSAAPAVSGRPTSRVAKLVESYRQSVWMPVAARCAGIALGMLSLAGIGAGSILAGLEGVPITAGMPLTTDIHSAWLAASREPEAEPNRPQPTAAPDSSAREAPREAPPSAGVTPDGKVILNSATVDDLMRLPGIGRRRAEAILELRSRLKKFKRPQDLLRVRGIGPRSLKRLMPHFVLDPPPPPK